VEGGGSISGPTSAKQGESVTLTFIPNDGYTISNVTIDSVAKGAISSYTFNNIAENHSVTVTFVSSGSGDAPPDSNVYEEQVYQEYDKNKVLLATLSRPSGVARQQTSHPRGAHPRGAYLLYRTNFPIKQIQGKHIACP
jgi:hypothetical protein